MNERVSTTLVCQEEDITGSHQILEEAGGLKPSSDCKRPAARFVTAGTEVSASTVRCILNAQGLHAWAPWRTHLLTQKLQSARTHINKSHEVPFLDWNFSSLRSSRTLGSMKHTLIKAACLYIAKHDIYIGLLGDWLASSAAGRLEGWIDFIQVSEILKGKTSRLLWETWSLQVSWTFHRCWICWTWIPIGESIRGALLHLCNIACSTQGFTRLFVSIYHWCANSNWKWKFGHY